MHASPFVVGAVGAPPNLLCKADAAIIAQVLWVLAANAHSCSLCGELPSVTRNYLIWEVPLPPHPSPFAAKVTPCLWSSSCTRARQGVGQKLDFSPSLGSFLDSPTTRPTGSLGLSCWPRASNIDTYVLYHPFDSVPDVGTASDGSSAWWSGLEEHMCPRAGLSRDLGSKFPCCVTICHPVMTHEGHFFPFAIFFGPTQHMK